MSTFAEHTAAASVQAFNDLKQAAIAEDWKTVDELLTTKREEIMRPVTVAWASGAGLRDSNPNVRDLAASILEKAVPEKDFGQFGADAMQLILDALQNDPNIYVRYRLAFALYQRKDRSPLVEAMMDEAEKDADVGDIARKYRGK